MKRMLMIDRGRGSTEMSLENLEFVLPYLEKEKKEGNSIRAYEIRSGNPNPRISFLFHSDNIMYLGGDSFWVPEDKDFSELEEYCGGTGTTGYRDAIALIYRYLNHQRRGILRLEKDELDALYDEATLLNSDSPLLAELDRYVDEDETIAKKVAKRLGFDHTFIVLDMETIGGFDAPRSEFIVAYTWDVYHGFRCWGYPQIYGLINEADKYDKVITFNGEKFDLEILAKYDFRIAESIKNNRSIDLYRCIYDAIKTDQSLSTQIERIRGGTTLKTIAKATLGMHSIEDCHPEDNPFYGGCNTELLAHCARDVEMTKELFFFGNKHYRVSIIGKNSERGDIIVQPVHLKWSSTRSSFFREFDGNLLFMSGEVKRPDSDEIYGIFFDRKGKRILLTKNVLPDMHPAKYRSVGEAFQPTESSITVRLPPTHRIDAREVKVEGIEQAIVYGWDGFQENAPLHLLHEIPLKDYDGVVRSLEKQESEDS